MAAVEEDRGAQSLQDDLDGTEVELTLGVFLPVESSELEVTKVFHLVAQKVLGLGPLEVDRLVLLAEDRQLPESLDSLWHDSFHLPVKATTKVPLFKNLKDA